MTDLDLKPGNYVNAGDRLFPLVKSGGWWVAANFDENQLEYIRPGMPAEVKVDMYPGITFGGVVTAVGLTSPAAASLPPPQNTKGHREATRRNTVRTHLTKWDPEHPFRLGASCWVKINIRVEPSEIP